MIVIEGNDTVLEDILSVLKKTENNATENVVSICDNLFSANNDYVE